MRLEEKRVLITGTDGRQGKAAQALFEREDARVIGCVIHTEARCRAQRRKVPSRRQFWRELADVLTYPIEGFQ